MNPTHSLCLHAGGCFYKLGDFGLDVLLVVRSLLFWSLPSGPSHLEAHSICLHTGVAVVMACKPVPVLVVSDVAVGFWLYFCRSPPMYRFTTIMARGRAHFVLSPYVCIEL